MENREDVMGTTLSLVKKRLSQVSEMAEQLSLELAKLTGEQHAQLLEELSSVMPLPYARMTLEDSTWSEIAHGWEVFSGIVERSEGRGPGNKHE